MGSEVFFQLDASLRSGLLVSAANWKCELVRSTKRVVGAKCYLSPEKLRAFYRF